MCAPPHAAKAAAESAPKAAATNDDTESRVTVKSAVRIVTVEIVKRIIVAVVTAIVGSRGHNCPLHGLGLLPRGPIILLADRLERISGAIRRDGDGVYRAACENHLRINLCTAP